MDSKVAELTTNLRSTLASRLAANRVRCFVGRNVELSAFEAFTAPVSPHRLWFISGPGGIGKSALLARMRDQAHAWHLPLLFLDARHVAPNPPAVRRAIVAAAGGLSLAAYCAAHARPLLLVDTFEHWHDLSDWLRRDFLPGAPANLGVIFAGRTEPDSAWLNDDSWRAAMRVTHLPNLSGEHCMRYLEQRAVPAHKAGVLSEFSKGNALVLAMAADAVRDGGHLELAPESGLSVYQTLLDNLLREARHADEYLALDACAVAYQLSEDLLARMLGRDDASALFEWLAGLTFIDCGSEGLYPHDIVREALMQTMPRRAPGRYEALVRIAVNWVVDRMESDHDLSLADAARVGAQAMYALRQVGVVQYYLHAEGADSLYVDRVRSEAEWNALAAMTRLHEGDESCAWFEFWRHRFPDNVTVIRGIQGDARAYVLRLEMERLEAKDRDADPLTRRLWRFIQETVQPAADEHMIFNRFWVNYDYRAYGSPEKTQMMMHITNTNLSTPDLRLTAQVFGTRTPSWPQQARAIGLHLVDQQAIAIGEHTYHIFYNDWLRESPMRYYRLFADRCIAFEQSMRGVTPAAPVSAGLDRDAFRDAVLVALRQLQQPAALADNPLLASAAVASAAGRAADAQTRISAINDLVSTAVKALKQNSSGRYQDVLRSAYIEPARNQKAAAAELDMPYSSYRRNLAEAREALVTELWRREQACRA